MKDVDGASHILAEGRPPAGARGLPIERFPGGGENSSIPHGRMRISCAPRRSDGAHGRWSRTGNASCPNVDAMSSTSVATDSVKERLGIDQAISSLAIRRRWLLGIALAAAVLAAARWWTSRGDTSLPAYVTRSVTRGDLVVTVTATGTLTPIHQVDVGSELSGIVERVFVDDNDRVRTGQVLARLDMTKLQAQANQIRAALDAARARAKQTQATLEEARAQFDRADALAARQLLPRSDLDAARAALARADADHDSARAAVAQSEASLRATETDLTKTVIRSPIDGVVLRRAIEPGQTVAASFQAPILFTLAESLTTMELDVDVDEADVGQVVEGQDATFTVDAYPDRTFSAKVAKVSFSATTTAGVVTYKTTLNVDNSNLLLRPGMTSTASIAVHRASNVTLVPNAALRFTPAVVEPPATGGNTLIGRLMPRPPRRTAAEAPDLPARRTAHQRVWVLQDGQPTPVDVTVGMSDGRMTELVDGNLADGTPLIVQSASGS